MENIRSSRGDLTNGTIWKKLVLFALPLLLSMFVQQLYNTVDLIFAGNFIDSDAAAAIGMSSMLANCLIGFFSGMALGSGVIIARAFGEGNRQKLCVAIHSTVALCIAGGVVLTICGELLAPVYLRLLRTPDALIGAANGYLRIYFLSMPAIIFYNLCSGMLRSLGDSRSTLYAQIVGGLFNILFDWLFLRIMRNGVTGVAWATLISQTISAAYVVMRLTRLDPMCALRLKRIAFDRATVRETVQIGVPAGFQALVITLSNVIAQYHINSLGKDAVAAFTAYFKVENLPYYPIVVMGQSVMTFAGQNLGARKYDRVIKGTGVGLMLALGATIAISTLGLIFAGELFGIFYRESEVIALGQQIVRVTFPFYFLYCFLQILGDCMRGTGESKVPMRIVLVNICIVRTLLLFLIVPRMPQVQSVAVCYPLTWGLSAVCMVLYYYRYVRKELLGYIG